MTRSSNVALAKHFLPSTSPFSSEWWFSVGARDVSTLSTFRLGFHAMRTWQDNDTATR